MKQLLTLTLFLFSILISVSTSAQDSTRVIRVKTSDGTYGEEVEVRINDGIYVKVNDHDEVDIKISSNLRFGMIDLGVSTYRHNETGFNLPSELDFMDQRLIKSTNININLIRHRLPFAKDKLGFEYGITIMSNKYFFENNFRVLDNQESFLDAVQLTDENFRKNRLTADYLVIPVNFVFRSNPGDLGNSLNIGLGGYGGFLMSSNHKIKGGDLDGKVKTKDDFGLTKFVAGLEARLGFGPVNLYAQYALTDMFRPDRGPDLRQFNFGVTILPY